MILNPSDMSIIERYRFMISTVVPRPIAWVSSTDADGVLNLAPFSYFTGVCNDPLTLIFCPVVPARQGSKKDTLRNIETTGEFVINMTNWATADAMNRTSTPLPPDESEFDWAKVTPAPSEFVKVPRVAEAPVAYECTLQQVVVVNDKPGGGAVVFGEVQRIHVNDAIYENGQVVLEKYDPIGRLGGDAYVHVTESFEMKRIPAPEKT